MGGGAMFSLALFYALIGAVLGLGFTVMVLLPTIALSAVVIIGINVAWGTGLWMAAIETVIALTSVQIGYLIGVGVRVFPDQPRLSVAAMSRSHPENHSGTQKSFWV
jgi:hypothetical protein